MLEQLTEMEMPGDPESNVGDYLDLAAAGSAEAKARLARCGIYYRGGRLHLAISNSVLMRLLISPLLREKGAKLDIATGVLSLPIEINPGV